MKYRIIHEVDGNEKEHWEVQFQKMSWRGLVWKNTKEYSNMGIMCGGFYVTARYDSYVKALRVVKSHECHRKIVDIGVINVTNKV
jgi:hypothetical protein